MYSPDGSRTRFTSKQADIVPWSQLTQRQKDAIHDDESSHVLWFVQIWIASHHDEPNAGLRNHTKRKCLLGSKLVTDEAAAEAAWDVEEIDEGISTEAFSRVRYRSLASWTRWNWSRCRRSMRRSRK